MTPVKKSPIAALQRHLDAGVPLGEAFKLLLVERDRAAGDREATTHSAITRFAERHELNRANTSSQLHGNRTMTWDVATALAADLGDTAGEWRELHWRLSHPAAAPTPRMRRAANA